MSSPADAARAVAARGAAAVRRRASARGEGSIGARPAGAKSDGRTAAARATGRAAQAPGRAATPPRAREGRAAGAAAQATRNAAGTAIAAMVQRRRHAAARHCARASRAATRRERDNR
jgi:hypothetical protein